MKRKRESINKKLKCRFKGCKGFRENDNNEFFCNEHRKYITKIQNADEIFYSTINTLYIPEDISVYIFMMNIPHLNKINQPINENSLSNRNMRDIHNYFFNIYLISKTIQTEFKKAIASLYNKIFVLDTNNAVISYRNKTFSEYGGKSIMTNCALLAKSKNGIFIWNECNLAIIEYYKLQGDATHLQAEATKAKNIAEKKRDEIYLDLISKSKGVMINNRII
jgi:hypothetical protein